MGQPDLFAKATFAEETARITGGAAIWQDPPEIRLEKIQCDGLILVRRPHLPVGLALPWPEMVGHEEIMVEAKLAGDHVDRRAVERALLRRQARQVQRVEDAEEGAPPWLGHEPLWFVAPYLPAWLEEVYQPVLIALGCYRVGPVGAWFLWIAANELPLRDELVPFLIARSGRALDELVRWVAHRRSPRWVLSMLECLAMSTTVQDELLWSFARPAEPEFVERRKRIIDVLLTAEPDVKARLIEEGVEKGVEKGIEKGREEGRLSEARAALRRVLARRKISLSPDDEARIDGCADRETLERWLDQAVTAASASEALQ